MFRKSSLILLLSMAMVNPFVAHFALAGTDPIPAGEAGAKSALEKSPRHHEWVNIAVP